MSTTVPQPRTMNASEQAALWQQRLFEAEAGMTRFLTEQHSGADLVDWLHVQSEIFADLPRPGSDDAQGWQRVFFRAQALMEKFLVTRYGEEQFPGWTDANAQVHRLVEPDHGGGAADIVSRVARQAQLYGSTYQVDAVDTACASIMISHCAIWDYRERARERGVPITLASPCTYCTKAISANVRAKGYVPHHELTTDRDGHGCRWTVTSPDEDPAPAEQ